MLFILHFLIMLPVEIYRRIKFSEYTMWKCLITDVYKLFSVFSLLSIGYNVLNVVYYYLCINYNIGSIDLTIADIVYWDIVVYIAYISVAFLISITANRYSDLKLLWWLGLDARYSRVSDFCEKDEDLDDSILMGEDDEPSN